MSKIDFYSTVVIQIIVALIAIFTVASCFDAQPPAPIETPVAVKMCHTPGRFTEAELPNAIPSIVAQGCTNAYWVHVDGKFFVYGTKVLVGDSSN